MPAGVRRIGLHPPMALSTSEADTQRPEVLPSPRPAIPLKLPELIPSIRLRQPTPFGNMHLHISVDPEQESNARFSLNWERVAILPTPTWRRFAGWCPCYFASTAISAR